MTIKHTYDAITTVRAEQAIWHADPNMAALVADIFEKVKPAQFVETGTHMGWTSHWIAERFPQTTIRTVELLENYYNLSGENLAGFGNIHRSLGDSRAFLRSLVPQLQGVTLFWLDAHFHADHPLREECAIVATCKAPYLALIDDYHCGADFPGDPAAPAMVEPTMGVDYWRPAYPYPYAGAGYILFVRGVGYTPPASMRQNVRLYA